MTIPCEFLVSPAFYMLLASHSPCLFCPNNVRRRIQSMKPFTKPSSPFSCSSFSQIQILSSASLILPNLYWYWRNDLKKCYDGAVQKDILDTVHNFGLFYTTPFRKLNLLSSLRGMGSAWGGDYPILAGSLELQDLNPLLISRVWYGRKFLLIVKVWVFFSRNVIRNFAVSSVIIKMLGICRLLYMKR